MTNQVLLLNQKIYLYQLVNQQNKKRLANLHMTIYSAYTMFFHHLTIFHNGPRFSLVLFKGGTSHNY